MSIGPWQILAIVAVIVILFARPGKISGLMADLGKGLRSFKKEVKSSDEDEQANTLSDDDQSTADLPKAKKPTKAKTTAQKTKAKAKVKTKTKV